MTSGPIAVVTDPSRGSGKPIALSSYGCTFYFTGRFEREDDAPMPSVIHATAQAGIGTGGRSIAARCDHSDEIQVEALSHQVIAGSGEANILVNNAGAIHEELYHPVTFSEKLRNNSTWRRYFLIGPQIKRGAAIRYLQRKVAT